MSSFELQASSYEKKQSGEAGETGVSLALTAFDGAVTCRLQLTTRSRLKRPGVLSVVVDGAGTDNGQWRVGRCSGGVDRRAVGDQVAVSGTACTASTVTTLAIT